MECLENGEVCKYDFKCKVCKLTDCNNTLAAIEEEQKMYFKTCEQKFKEELEKNYPYCVVKDKVCSQLIILDLENGKIRCPYMINKRCAIK